MPCSRTIHVKRAAGVSPAGQNKLDLPAGRRKHVSEKAIVHFHFNAWAKYKNWRLPASYANFYIANACVIVPTFNDPNDRIALGILGELFPDREVVGIHAVDLVLGYGTLHCLSQQQPAVVDPA